MKTLLKLIILLTTLGFTTANAALSTDQKDAIKIVTDAVATGNEAKIKTAVNEQIALYPEIAADIVTAALNATTINDQTKEMIIRVAAFTAPNQLANIITAINAFYVNPTDPLIKKRKAKLIRLASSASRNGTTVLNATNGKSNNSNTNKSLVSFN